MKHLALFLALISWCLLLFSGCSPYQDSYSIGGQILTEDGKPVEGVTVGLTWYGHDMHYPVATDSAGWYSHDVLPIFFDDELHISPYRPAYTFSPGFYNFFNGLDGDHLDLDFTAIPKV